MSYPDIGSPMDPSEHESHNIPQATEHYAGDVIPISQGRTEAYPGQNGVINSTGKLSQHLNDSPYRNASDRTNIVPLRIGK